LTEYSSENNINDFSSGGIVLSLEKKNIFY